MTGKEQTADCSRCSSLHETWWFGQLVPAIRSQTTKGNMLTYLSTSPMLCLQLWPYHQLLSMLQRSLKISKNNHSNRGFCFVMFATKLFPVTQMTFSGMTTRTINIPTIWWYPRWNGNRRSFCYCEYTRTQCQRCGSGNGESGNFSVKAEATSLKFERFCFHLDHGFLNAGNSTPRRGGRDFGLQAVNFGVGILS